MTPINVEDTKVTKTWIKFLAKDYDRMVLMRGVGAVRGTLDLEEFRLSRINRDLIGRYIYTVLAKAFG